MIARNLQKLIYYERGSCTLIASHGRYILLAMLSYPTTPSQGPSSAARGMFTPSMQPGLNRHMDWRATSLEFWLCAKRVIILCACNYSKVAVTELSPCHRAIRQSGTNDRVKRLACRRILRAPPSSEISDDFLSAFDAKAAVTDGPTLDG